MFKIEKTYIDEGPKGWNAGAHDVTRQDRGLIDPQAIKDLPGQSNEHRLFARCSTGRMTRLEWLAFCTDLVENGMQHPVTVFKEKDGTVHINEGNHRLRAALEMGWTEMPVEIRYFGNSQREGLVVARCREGITE